MQLAQTDVGRRRAAAVLSVPREECWYRSEGAPSAPSETEARDLQLRVWGAFEREDADAAPAVHLANAIAGEARRPDSSALRIARLAHADPVIAGRLLSVANSAYYGFQSAADTLQEAIVRIGTIEVQRIAYALAIDSVLQRLVHFRALAERAWRHSLAVSIAAGRLALLGDSMAGRRAPLAGLLHDIGVPVLLAAAETVSASHENVAWFEDVVWPLHLRAGSRMAEDWHLDEELRAAVELHHHPEGAPPLLRPMAVVVSDADRLSRVTVDRPDEDAAALAVAEIAVARGVDEASVRTLAETLPERVEAFSANI